MKDFLRQFAPLVLGVLIGFDRWRFRGGKRMLSYPDGVMGFLSRHSILPKKFNKPYAEETTDRLGAAIEKPAQAAGIYRFLNAWADRRNSESASLPRDRQRPPQLLGNPGRTVFQHKGVS